MKPVAFQLERPSTVAAAAALLAQDGAFVKPIAGSQSLGPMLNLRLAQPDLLVDITGIPELAQVADGRERLEIGACVTHADIEDGRVPDVTRGLMRHVAGRIAYRAVRNRGTIGGSLAHADPAADWVSVLPLLDARIAARSGRGAREIAAADLVLSSFSTVLRADEMIVSVSVPRLSAEARWGYCKFSHKVGEFGHAIAGVLHDPGRGVFRAVIGAIETAPIVVPDAAAVFGKFGRDIARRMDVQAVISMLDRRNVTDRYTRSLAVVALRRAAEQAAS